MREHLRKFIARWWFCEFRRNHRVRFAADGWCMRCGRDVEHGRWPR